jgi:hypothetical protein
LRRFDVAVAEGGGDQQERKATGRAEAYRLTAGASRPIF